MYIHLNLYIVDIVHETKMCIADIVPKPKMCIVDILHKPKHVHCRYYTIT